MDVLKAIRRAADADIYSPSEHGWMEVIALDAKAEVAETIVQLAKEESGLEMNWGFVAGLAVVYAPKLKSKCRAAIISQLPGVKV